MGYKSKFTGKQIDALLEKVGQGGGSASAMEYVAFESAKDLATYGEVLSIFGYLVKFPTKIETMSIMLTSGGRSK